MIIMIPLLRLKKTKNTTVIDKIQHFRNYAFSIAVVVLICTLCISCVNEDNQLGLNLVKSNGGLDVLHSPDNIVKLNTYVYKTDSLETAQKNNFILGSYRDEIFGRIRTSIYTSLDLADNSGYDFTSMGNIDSAVLCLAYAVPGAFSADTSVRSDNLTIGVYMLTQNIDSTKKYAFDTVAVNTNPLFLSTILSDPTQGVFLEGDTNERPPHLRMKLSEDFINKLHQGKYETQEAFSEDFKGIKITAESSSDSYLACINMISSYSNIIVYYHSDNNVRGSYTINFSNKGQRFMHIDKDYSLSSLSDFAKSTDTLNTQQYIYIASLGIAEAGLNLLNLDSWYKQDSVNGAVLNRAELILPVASVFNKSHLFPNSLLAFRKEEGKYYYIADEIAVDNWMGNKYDASINAYRIDVTLFLQKFLAGQYKDCSLYLIPDTRLSYASRVILNGPASDNPPKLNIIYSFPAED
ncbi:MAG: DUF4270 family protein [Bacteroidales bacterium]|nr:DUF4270 family protein [Bacteroidales bacterium]